MQGIGSQCLAACLLGNPRQRPPAVEINNNGHNQNPEGQRGGVHRSRFKPQAVIGLVKHHARQHHQQACFDQSGQRLDFAVAVMMVVVSGFVGGLDGKIGDHGSAGIQQRMTGFRNQSEGSRQ